MNEYHKSNVIFKKFKEQGLISEKISRPKAVKAIYQVLIQREAGNTARPDLPLIEILLSNGMKYSNDYIVRVKGLYRYLAGEYTR